MTTRLYNLRKVISYAIKFILFVVITQKPQNGRRLKASPRQVKVEPNEGGDSKVAESARHRHEWRSEG